MIDAILAELDAARAFDFRCFAHPRDPLRHLFDEWVDYYRLKFAIAKVIAPRSILEIGVRFGYSARTMLEAAPEASFTGIDLDSDTFGGVSGGLAWAKRITERYDVSFVVADSQALCKLPGGPYDLAHVDGQQDGDGTLHDLALALRQSRFVLLDGFLWSEKNAHAGAEALRRYRRAIEHALVIPGYAGELLVKVAPAFLHEMAAVRSADQPSTSGALRSTYTRSYFLGDCGGYESYKRSSGVVLEDARLATVARLAAESPAGRALDLGCGRGELTRHFATKGRGVTAIDYSVDAIDLARAILREPDDVAGNVRFVCDDVNTATLDVPYAVAVAVDLIEHLAPAELDQLYHRVHDALDPRGLFIVHTAPNLWRYRYEQARRRRVARSVDAFIPKEPRSEYELLMHINEQSPRTLRDQLRRCFPHVAVWCASGEDAVGTLADPRLSKFRSYESIFAVASKSELSPERLLGRLRMIALPTQDLRASLTIDDCAPLYPGGVDRIAVTIANLGRAAWKSVPPHPVCVSYHWYAADSGRCIEFDGLRTPIDGSLGPGDRAGVAMLVRAPDAPGRYRLRATLVQEHVGWFDGHGAFADCIVEVVDAT